LQMTMETEDTTERLSAPTVPSWNFSPPTPISAAALETQQHHPRHRQTNRGMPRKITNFQSSRRNHAAWCTCSRERPHFDQQAAPASAHKKTDRARSDLPLLRRLGRSDLGEEGANLGRPAAMARRSGGGAGGIKAVALVRPSGLANQGRGGGRRGGTGWFASLLFIIWLVGRSPSVRNLIRERAFAIATWEGYLTLQWQ
jgi:hypothetical protein